MLDNVEPTDHAAWCLQIAEEGIELTVKTKALGLRPWPGVVDLAAEMSLRALQRLERHKIRLSRGKA
jgi:hypothetical protein